MRTLDKRLTVSRRRFLVTSGATAAGIGAVSAGALVMDPKGAWAINVTTLSGRTAATLVQVARDLYPHDRLDDSYYARAIEPYDAAAAEDAELRALLEDGVAALDAAAQADAGTDYLEIEDEAVRVGLLRGIQDGDFFKKLRGDLVVSLYNQPEVWARFGYEGSSWEQGGYLNRGFDDLDWL